jgi:hypothetical protein
VADFIMSSIGAAIDWAVAKWESLKSIVSGGSVFSQSDMSYLGLQGGGGTTNNNSTVSVGNVNVYSNNGEKVGAGIVRGLNAGQSNGGNYF